MINNTTPEVDYDVDSVTVCSGTPDGSITVLKMDGSTDLSSYYFLWYSGADTSTFIGGNADVDSSNVLASHAAGQYTVLAIDSTSGCSSAQVTFQIDEVPSLPSATLFAKDIAPKVVLVFIELLGSPPGVLLPCTLINCPNSLAYF